MVVRLEDTTKVRALFDGWKETLIDACLQKVMGTVYVTDLREPRAALCYVGCFGFFAGEPDAELARFDPGGFSILTPQNERWAALIEAVRPDAEKLTRYAIKKDTQFDADRLRRYLRLLPEGYELREIDGALYGQCLAHPVTRDFVSVFGSKERFLRDGRGVVILKDGQIVSGASSYVRSLETVELEVETLEPERRRGLALAACSALILRCLGEGLYPSWDAANMASVCLAEKLGYELDHPYTAYAVSAHKRTH